LPEKAPRATMRRFSTGGAGHAPSIINGKRI
jgi:hypothetical protein